MKNGKQIVLRASEGITFRVQGEEDNIVIEAIIENTMCSNSCYNYKNPYIPEGYVHLCGTWETGFVIQNKEDGSEFVWIPALYLDEDGTIDGKNFNEKFGRKNWYNSDFSEKGWHEEANQSFTESVKKYGGFYFSRYHASTEKGKLVFKKGNQPWVNINYYDAEKAAANYAKNSKDVISQITNGAAFDTVLRWIIKSKAKTYDEIVKDSTSWGNYWNTQNPPREVMPTGSSEAQSVLGIYDLAGNVVEWTSEIYGIFSRVQRGGDHVVCGYEQPAAKRDIRLPDDYWFNTSFRAVLYIK